MQEEFDDALRVLLPDHPQDNKILMAISGGMDSMCMAHLFLNSSVRNDIAIAHVNFALRETDCDLDQRMVEEYATKNNIPFYTTKFDTKEYAKENSISAQMAARELRYDWFFKIQKEFGYDYIAIAHNSDDSVETLFLNLLRGTGVKGLAGIRAKNDRIIRPLLPFMRERITSFVAANNVPYRDDYTNFESHYSRNRLRNVVFPEMRKINPSFVSTVFRSISRFTDGVDVLDDLFEKKKGTLYNINNGVVSISIFHLKKEKSPAFWLYKIVDDYGFNSFQISQIVQAIEGQSGKIFHSTTHELVIDREEIIVYERVEKEDSILIEAPGLYSFGGVELKIDVYLKPDGFRPRPIEGQLFMDAERVHFPILCRHWKHADRFVPFGMKGAKKLSDFFIDLKMNKRAKDRQIVLTNVKNSEEQIFCLAGLRIDDRYKIHKKSNIILEVTLF